MINRKSVTISRSRIVRKTLRRYTLCGANATSCSAKASSVQQFHFCLLIAHA
jgi:hypothetical protein